MIKDNHDNEMVMYVSEVKWYLYENHPGKITAIKRVTITAFSNELMVQVVNPLRRTVPFPSHPCLLLIHNEQKFEKLHF